MLAGEKLAGGLGWEARLQLGLHGQSPGVPLGQVLLRGPQVKG